MTTLEQVERLREKANVSFEEAKAALDASNGDILDALIYLEKQGKVNAPVGGGYYSSGTNTDEEKRSSDDGRGTYHENGGTFGDMVKRFGRFCAKVFKVGNTNNLVAVKNGEELFACPVTAVVLLVIFFFWVVIPLFILSLFFGFRYHFHGDVLGTEPVNKVMDGATDTAEDIKRNFSSEHK